MKNKKISISLKIALIVMFISFFGITTLGYISYIQAKNIFISYSTQILSKNISEYANSIKESIRKLKYNITILSHNPSIKDFISKYPANDKLTNKIFEEYKKDVSTIISLMIKQNPEYFQIRILDAKNGKEIINIVKENNKIKVLEKKALQDKWMRPWVQNTLKLTKDKIYISKIKLHRKSHTIEFPIKPTIKATKLIFTKDKKTGIIVINADIKKLFHFNKLREIKDTKTYIANKEGYYIFNYNHPEKEFGFEFGKDFKIIYDFPLLKPIFEGKIEKITFIDKKNNLILEAQKVYIAPKRYLVILKTITTAIFEKKANEYIENLIIVILIITFIITILTTLLVSKITEPIKKLTQIADVIAKTKGEKHVKINIKTNDEIEELAKAFEIMLKALTKSKKEIEQFANKLEKEVEKKTKELQEINKNLQKIVNEKVNELREKDKALVQQSKMAAMGEMIGAIAHQWRQPLNALAINIQFLEDLYDEGKLNKKTLEEFIEKNMQTIQFMSNTIDDFRNFFRKDKEKIEFNIKEAIEKTLNLQKAQLKNHNIEIITDLKPAKTKGYKNEFMQAVLNLISNAKDAIEEKRTKENSDFRGEIKISNKIKNGKIIIEIEDNGGGVPKEIKDRIFEPYFTTKKEGKGTGMGLYMVKEIVERMDGSIETSNTKKGAKFTIILKEYSGS
ncbi:MAG: ATP-binding protein [Nautiliaceae bacterium]